MKRFSVLMVLVISLCMSAGCDWTPWSEDDDSSSSNAAPEEAPVWTGVAAGSSHMVALKDDGSLWTWGENAQGQLGLGTWANKDTPQRVGTDTWIAASAGLIHTLAIRSDGRLWSWGSNISGQLGCGGFPFRSNEPILESSDSDWTHISAGDYHSIALREDGSLWACGNNDLGQLGDGTFQYKVNFTKIGGDAWEAVSAGGNFSMGLKPDGTLWAWGQNSSGQLGISLETNQSSPVKVGIDEDWAPLFSTGDNHVLAVKKDGSLWAWGENGSGQLGDGTNDSQYGPVLIDSGHQWISVSTGATLSLGVRSDGSLWAWGSAAPVPSSDGIPQHKNRPVQVGSDLDWASVCATRDANLAVKSGGTMWKFSPGNPVPVMVGGE